MPFGRRGTGNLPGAHLRPLPGVQVDPGPTKEPLLSGSFEPFIAGTKDFGIVEISYGHDEKLPFEPVAAVF